MDKSPGPAAGARGLKWSETPKLPYTKLPVSGGLFWKLGHRARPGEWLHGRMAEVCDKYFARGLDRRLGDGYITG